MYDAGLEHYLIKKSFDYGFQPKGFSMGLFSIEPELEK